MKFTEEEKRLLLKTSADIIKRYRGVGPRNHYIKYYDKEFHIIVSGSLTKMEKYFCDTFGQEYFDAVEKFYFHFVKEALCLLDQALLGKYKFKLLEWEPDFMNDRVVYKIKHI